MVPKTRQDVLKIIDECLLKHALRPLYNRTLVAISVRRLKVRKNLIMELKPGERV